jgi:hypothetical protein
MFLNVPSEVFEAFLVPLIGDVGWPFHTIHDSTRGTAWIRLLGELSLKEFSNLRWNIYTLSLNKDILDPVSYGDIQLLIRDHVQGIETPLRRYVMNSKTRFLWHVKYIQGAGRLVAPIIMVVTFNGLRILDGIHRTAALFALGFHGKIPIKAWIGSF